MKQFATIFKFELRAYLKNKIFIGTTIFLVLAIAAAMFIPNIFALAHTSGSSGSAAEHSVSAADKAAVSSNKAAESGQEADTLDKAVSDRGTDTPGPGSSDSENDSASAERPLMLVQVSDEALAGAVEDNFSETFAEYRVERAEGAPEEIQQKLLSGGADCAFVIDSPVTYTYYANNLSMYDDKAERAEVALRKLYQTNVMVKYGMSQAEAEALLSVQIEGSTVSLGKDQMKNFFYTYIMIFVLYLVILLYGQMVATNVATEKSSRAMELLITSARPASMMFGKVTASCIAGIIQLSSVFGSALIFYNLNRGAWAKLRILEAFFDVPLSLFGYMLLFFILGFLLYAFMYGAVGSTVSSLEDINTSVMPFTFLFIISFFVSVFSMTGSNTDNFLLKLCSYIPFTSPMAMFTRICMSTVAWYEILLSVLILFVSTVGVGLAAAKIYRAGVLMYGTKPKLSAIIRILWKA